MCPTNTVANDLLAASGFVAYNLYFVVMAYLTFSSSLNHFDLFGPALKVFLTTMQVNSIALPLPYQWPSVLNDILDTQTKVANAGPG